MITHFPGHGFDELYLNVPLRGEFAIDAELASFDWRETKLSYGGVALGIRHNRKSFDVSRHGRYLPDGIIDPPLEGAGDWYASRLVARDGTMAAYVNGRKIDERRLPEDADPWLSIATVARCRGGARTLSIAGKPVVPEGLRLSSPPDLSGWRADYL